MSGDCKHTPCPADYLGWHAWAERKSLTHTQHRCPDCGLWAIWKRKGATPQPNSREQGK